MSLDADWRNDFAGASLETRDAGFEAAAVAAAGANRRRLVQSALRLAARQIERTAQPLLASLLAIVSRQPYAAERKGDINALLTRTAQAGFEDLLLGLDPKLRDADAHGEFEIDDHGVRLTGSRGTLDYLNDDELVDAALAGTESITALYWGLVAALVSAGVDIEMLGDAVAAEIAVADKIKLILLLNGWRDVEVRVDGEHATARGERDAENAMGLIAAVVSVMPETCTTLTLVASDDEGTHTASGPVIPFRQWNSASEKTKEVAFTQAGMAWAINGDPIVTRAHAEKVFVYRTLEALDPEVPPAVALAALRALLDASRVIGSQELALAITSALRLRREVAARGRVTRSAESVVSDFDRWLVELPDIRSSW